MGRRFYILTILRLGGTGCLEVVQGLGWRVVCSKANMHVAGVAHKKVWGTWVSWVGEGKQ